jgi:rhodanese-related sulfurtransferase
MSYRQVKVRKDPDCAVCGDNPTVTELIDYEAFCGAVSDEAQAAAADSTITPKQLKQWMDEGENIEVIDVREPNEFEIVSIPGAKLIPKNEFLMGDALGGLPQDKRIVLNCKTGVRSAEVLAVLKNAGFADAVHVGGGVIGWVNQIARVTRVYFRGVVDPPGAARAPGRLTSRTSVPASGRAARTARRRPPRAAAVPAPSPRPGRSAAAGTPAAAASASSRAGCRRK